ncbi:ABC transporter substrate-binding protein [Streptomyces amritsarensis]|nr:ABC transporter substrate-binding protein [Streptomyces amritsarensis]
MPVRSAMPGRRQAAAAAFLTVAFALTACGGGSGSPADAKPRAAGADCVEDFDPAMDYFPVKSTVKHAKNFTLRYEKSYQVLTVNEPFPKGKPESYVLVKCGAPKPELTGELASAQQVTVPVKSLYSASTTHLPLLTETGTLDVLTGVASATNISSAQVIEHVKAGKVTEYAKDRTLNAETVIGAKPDVLMTQGTDDPQYPKLRQAGIAVVANAEWLEPSPLGRAEWVKAMAALTGAEKRAGEVFDTIEGDYRKIAEKGAQAVTAGKPVEVLPGTMYQGTWNMPAGGSYAAQLIKDAGGTYPWAGEAGTGNLQLNFEAVYAKGGEAPVWIADQKWKSTADAVQADSRYGQLKALTGGAVWTNTKALGPGGGNDYFERGVLRPDLVLADLFALIHPDQAKDHAFTFYTQVPKA